MVFQKHTQRREAHQSSLGFFSTKNPKFLRIFRLDKLSSSKETARRDRRTTLFGDALCIQKNAERIKRERERREEKRERESIKDASNFGDYQQDDDVVLLHVFFSFSFFLASRGKISDEKKNDNAGGVDDDDEDEEEEE